MTTQTIPNPFAAPNPFAGQQTQPNPFGGIPQFQGAPQMQQPQQPQMPDPGLPYQTLDIDTFRWKRYHGSLKAGVVKIAALVGTNFPADDNEQNNGALSNDDLCENPDGSSDMDFEESSIEVLGEVEQELSRMLQTAQRFRHNLMIRPHSDVPTRTPEAE
jgi:hypothetical protein